MPKELSQSVVEEWVALTKGRFNVRDVWGELNIQTAEGKKHLRTILNRLEQKGIIASVSRDGTFRRVDTELEILDWQSADPTKIVPLKFPFDLENYVRVHPQAIIILAGEKDSGKTAWLYNFVHLNMHQFSVRLFVSEAGKEQVAERMAPLGIPKPAPFITHPRYDNFADVIEPERVNVIDYLDLNSEVYLVGAEIDAIFRKLTTGVAVIGLQKPPGRDLAYGAGFSAKRAQLYLSLGGHKLKIVYVKARKNPKVNPINMVWSFTFDETGTCFDKIERYYGDF